MPTLSSTCQSFLLQYCRSTCSYDDPPGSLSGYPHCWGGGLEMRSPSIYISNRYPKIFSTIFHLLDFYICLYEFGCFSAKRSTKFIFSPIFLPIGYINVYRVIGRIIRKDTVYCETATNMPRNLIQSKN